MVFTQEELRELEYKVQDSIIRAGESLARAWQDTKIVRHKIGADPVTQFDVSVEETIRKELNQLLPAAGFFVEEGESEEEDEFNWVIDPIDQTKNFVGQIPLFYVQSALLWKSEPIIGVIYNPVSKQVFSASRGNRATLNGTKLPVLPGKPLDRAIADIDIGGYGDNLASKMCIIEELITKAFRVRMTAGAFAPYIATGGIDLYIVINEATKIVDQAPREIVMKEAGLVSKDVKILGHHVVVWGHPDTVEEVISTLIHLET